MAETLLFIGIVLLLAWVQFMLMSIMWQRFMRLLRMQDPRTTRVIIHAYGTDARATYRALAKHTRLDLQEIDDMIEEQKTGPLPIALGTRQANLLAADLRANGGEVELVYHAVAGHPA
jgi:hypothetical protein